MIKFKSISTPIIGKDEINRKAAHLFKGSCFACEVCNGEVCAGLIPGMGAVGEGNSFRSNIKALKKYKINTKLIHNVDNPDTSTHLFGYKLKIPILAAPITGTDVNMNHAIDELKYDKIVVNAFNNLGSMAMLGDGAEPEQYLVGIESIKQTGGQGICIFKPRTEQKDIIRRIKKAEDIGCAAVGCDVDAVCFLTMKLANQPVSAKSERDLTQLIKATSLPFIIKGIMTKEDAILAFEAGASAIVVSNHGGRVLDDMPGTLDVLPEIVRAVKNRRSRIILVDGGIRSGIDVFKCLALGADAVLIGRPIAISAIGAGIKGVEHVVGKMAKELKETMVLTGTENIANISSKALRL